MIVDYENKEQEILVKSITKDETNLILYFKNNILYSQLYPQLPLKSSFYLIPNVVAAANHAKNILVLGVGLGAIIIQLQELLPNSIITAVDIEPTVLSLAQKYIGSKNIIYECSDARNFVKNTQNSYDCIVCDISIGKSLPSFTYQIEFLQDMYNVLNPQGFLAFNSCMKSLDVFSDFVKVINPIEIIYNNFYAAGFGSLYQNDFKYGGWIFAFKEKVEISFIHETLYQFYKIRTNEFVLMSVFIHYLYLKRIDNSKKESLNLFNFQNQEIITSYTSYLFKMLMTLRHISLPNYINEEDNFKDLFFLYAKKALSDKKIKNFMSNIYECNYLSYFESLFKNKDIDSFEYYKNMDFIMLPSKQMDISQYCEYELGKVLMLLQAYLDDKVLKKSVNLIHDIIKRIRGEING